jgi:hypothetical protein
VRVPISPEALALENRSIGVHGEPTLGAAYALLRDQWRAGERDRELALHLGFLAWYLNTEPPHLTGAGVPSDELSKLAAEVHDWLLPDGAASLDVEALYVIGIGAGMFAWAFGDEPLWEARSEAYGRRYRQLCPDGIPADVFANRGAYGSYYENRAKRDDSWFG